MRDFDRKASGCLWAFFVVLAVGVSAPFAMLAATGKPNERVAALAVAIGAGPVMMLIALAAVALLLSRHRSAPILAAVDALAGRYGGATMLPTLRQPIVQPRVVASVDGRELEIRFVRMSGAMAAMHGGAWHVLIMLHAPARFRFGVVTRRLFLAYRASVVGLKPLTLGVPALDAEAVAVADDTERALASLRDDEVLARVQAILARDRVATKLQLGPSSAVNPLGLVYEAPVDPANAREVVVAVVDELRALVVRLRALGVVE